MDILIRPFRLISRLAVLFTSFALLSALVVGGFFVVLFLWRFLMMAIPVCFGLIFIAGFLKVMSDP